ncbi:periplasmic heavy metal sensor [Parasulfuritortus cantonensis]|uniref:Periplasmic heavy metal sensor n=1 Tax=Parasulfuritortus cantonensis TaxID=2528202 RepID=A0A4V2NX36_9PROT|nr:periplasmic heavy metal sensor [Parasulfuritortus cantonensis]TCJ19762.1 periplasmic heavy metal sensor [Parasulfuritortus cantonensis]
MKKTLIALAILLAIPTAGALAYGPGQGQGPGYGMRGGPNVEYMARVLDLTPEQQEKMKVLFAEKAKQRAEMRAAMQADMQAKMQSILTKEQYAKMADLRQLRQGGPGAGMGPGMGGRGAGMGPGAAGGCPRGMW